MSVRTPLVLAFSLVILSHAALVNRGGVAAARPQSQPPDDVSIQLYERHIRPLFEEHCQACHSGESKQGGFDMSSAASLLRGGTRGQAITPGKARTSLLFRTLTHEQEPAMPYKAAKLSREAIALVELWINLGAHIPASQANERANVPATTPATPSKVAERQFIEHVRPVLQAQCFGCHGGKFKQAGLNFQTRDSLLKGSDNGAVVVPGKADESLLIKKIRHEHEPGMPYKAAKLSEPVIGYLVAWVNAGVPYDRRLELVPAIDE